jgi:NTE family protein
LRTHAGELSVFEGVPADELARSLADLERRIFPVDSVVIEEGDRTNEIYIVQAGSAEVLVSDTHGMEHRVGRVVPGGTVGEISFLTKQPAVATVRATAEVDVLVLEESDFTLLAENFPQIYRNVGAILAERLARTDRLVVGERERPLSLLHAPESPPLLGYALAASIAWHTRERTLLVVLEDDVPDDLVALSTMVAEPPWRSGRASGEVGADLMVAKPTGNFAPDALPGTLGALFGVFEHVLVQVGGDSLPPLATARLVRLQDGGLGAETGEAALTVRGWVDKADRSRPGFDRVVDAPPLNAEDERCLQQGVLPNDTPAGRELGWAARDLARLKVGIAFGAGSVRGYAHVGVLNGLRRAGIPFDYIAGTSVGAAVAGMTAAEYPPEEIAEVMDDLSRRLFRLTVPVRSFLSNRGLKGLIQKLSEDTRIEDLPVPLALIAADVVTQQELVLRRGLAWPAILASSSIPGVFPAIKLGEHVAVDGGVLNPVPSSVVADMGADVVLAVKLGGGSVVSEWDYDVELPQGRPPNAIAVLVRAIELMQGRIAPEPSEATIITIAPKFEGEPVKLRNFIGGRRYIAAGEAAVEAALPRIKASLPWVRG